MGDFGVKELYDVTFKLNYSDRIFGRDYEKDEVILRFDRIDMAVLNEYRTRTAATGGYLNRVQVYWDEPRAMNFTFTSGVTSKQMLSILTNNHLINKAKINVPIKEEINVIGIDSYKLKFPINLDKPYFLYRDNEKLNRDEYYFENNILYINDKKYNNLLLDYYTLKEEQNILRIGQNFIGGFLKMEGKTRLKDDIDGQEKTGIITIPKLRIMSDLSIRLGKYESPNIYNFNIEGQPTEGRYGAYICDIQFLDTDIDADIL